MEHQTMTSLGGTGVGLVAHELGHQWYGDQISPKTWPHLWLNEGFATYSELLYYEARSGTYPGQFEGLLAARYNSAINATGTLVLEDTTSVSNMFAFSRVYAKGAVVLHMLRNVIGDLAFKNTMRAYSADPAVQYGVANTDDFHRVAEGESGMDLDQFFSQWVTDGYGIPFYRSFSFWQAAPGGGWDVWTTVEQWQTEPYSNIDVFEMPLDIDVITTSGTERFRVQNDQRHQVFALHVTNQPTGVAIDPDYWIVRSRFSPAWKTRRRSSPSRRWPRIPRTISFASTTRWGARAASTWRYSTWRGVACCRSPRSARPRARASSRSTSDRWRRVCISCASSRSTGWRRASSWS